MYKEKYGFIYIWYDKKHKRFYLGRHWGTEDDGYICSSTNMRNNYNNRPQDFKRRVISKINTSQEDLILEEQRWLEMIRTDYLNGKYYNKTNRANTPSTRGYNHSPETIEKIRKSNKGKTISEETKQKLRDANKKQFKDENQRELRRQKSLELWSDPIYKEKQILVRSKEGFYKGFTKKHSEISKEKMSKKRLGVSVHTDESKKKISKAFSQMIWINNEKENRRINKYEEIPIGYVKGRIKK